jgi:hypothetical protein
MSIFQGGQNRWFVWIVLLGLVGCSGRDLSPTRVLTSSPTVTGQPTATAINTPTAIVPTITISPVPTATTRPIGTATPTAEPTLTPPTIVEYTNDEYGFSFSYPSNWLLVESPHRILLASGSVGSLLIQFKRMGEEVVITRTGVPAGDLVAEGFVDFLGEAVAREVLVYQGRDKAVLYEAAAEIERGELLFTIWLQSNRPDYESIDIPGNVQREADGIVESFRSVN